MDSRSEAPLSAEPYPAGLPGTPEGAELSAPSPEDAEARSWWRRILGPLGGLGVLILSAGTKLKGLLLLLTKVKFASTLISGAVSVGAYALIWTWKFALGFVLLLFIHEMGHVWQLRREGIAASAPMFIPFMGAAVAMRELPDDAAAEARVGLAGPILGSVAVLVPAGLYLLTGDDLFRALTFIGFALNLFNLAPVLPLDGGRALQALSPWIVFVSILLFLGIGAFFLSPILLILIALLGGSETWRRFKQRKTPEARRFNAISARTRLAIAATYLGLVAVLVVGVSMAYFPAELAAAS
jgi:Zn-dependent protease